MENEIIISDNNWLEGYIKTLPPVVGTDENIFGAENLGYSADIMDDTLPPGVTISGNGITVDNDFGEDVMLDGTGVVNFADRDSYVTVNASQTTYNMRIYGNSKNNVIRGGNGENTLFGGNSGNNSLTGGNTRDYFRYNGVGRTTVTDFTTGKSNNSDVILFTDDAAASRVEFSRSGSTVRMKFGDDTANNVTLIGAGSDDSIIPYAVESSREVRYAKIGRSTLSYDDEVAFFHTNSGGTIYVRGDSGVNIWMDGHLGQNFSGVKNLNTANSSGYNTLVGGNGVSNSILGGYGNSSLWGGYGSTADDTLYGGSGSEMFWYGRNDGNDFVKNAAANDTIFLYDSVLDHIEKITAVDMEMTIGFDSKSSLFVTATEANGPTIVLADKSRWRYHYDSATWTQG